MIYEKKDFLNVFERERARSDRMGHDISIIIIDLEKSDHDEMNIKTLGMLIRKRLRCYDVIGWFDTNRLGVLLPCTSGAGARKIAGEIKGSIFSGTLHEHVTMFTYPGDWIISPQDEEACITDAGSGEHGQITAWAMASEKLIRQLEIPRNQMPLWKRLIDIAGACMGIVMLLPVFVMLAVYIKAVSPGPAFFKQRRVGYMGKTFNCFKFRTMHTKAQTVVHNSYFIRLMETEAPMEKLDSLDVRIIPLGRLMRKMGLDELPQLLNVLAGDMSLIGPRPCIPYEAEQYKVWQRRRFESVPGLTGLWQVSGKNRTTFNEMMRYDISYTLKKNFLLDVWILLKTMPAIIDQAMEINGKGYAKNAYCNVSRYFLRLFL